MSYKEPFSQQILKKKSDLKRVHKKKYYQDDYDLFFKTVVVGDVGVGKSTLISQFAKEHYPKDYMKIVGVNLHMKTISINIEEEGLLKVRLQIWGPSCQESFSSIRPVYYPGSLGAVIMFDLTSKNSFENLPLWIKEIKSNLEDEIPLLLVGNKCDLVDQRAISTRDIVYLTQMHDLEYMQISAKTGKNVEEVLPTLVKLMALDKKKQPSKFKTKGEVARDQSSGGLQLLLKHFLETGKFNLFFTYLPDLPDLMRKQFLVRTFPVHFKGLEALEEKCMEIKEIFEKSSEIYGDLNLYDESRKIYELYLKINRDF